MIRHALIVLVALGGSLGCDNDGAAKVPSHAPRAPTPSATQGSAPTPPADAEPQPSAAAWVDGEAIELAALDAEMQRLRAYYVRHRRPFPDEVARERRVGALHALIDQTLLRRRVLKAGIEMSEAAVDAEIETRVGDIFGSRHALERHLSERGWSMPEYREKVRLELGTRELLGSRIEPTEDELHTLYRNVANRPATVERVRARSVIFPPDTPVTAVERMMPGIDSETEFGRLARSGARELPLSGWISRTAVDARLAARLFAADAPGPTDPVATPSGVQVYWVSERVVEPTEHFRQIEPILRERAAGAELARQRAELVANLRQQAEIRIEPTLSERTAPGAQTP